MPRGCNAGLPLLRRHVLLPDVGALVGGGTLSYAHVQGRQVPVRAQLRDRALRTADADGGGTLVSVDVTMVDGSNRITGGMDESGVVTGTTEFFDRHTNTHHRLRREPRFPLYPEFNYEAVGLLSRWRWVWQ